jgi:predicted SprT family Zn-dependent metalloprotease
VASQNFAFVTARRVMAEYDLDVKGWTFGFDRAARRFGCCNYGTKTITLSAVTLAARTEREVEQTILHEVAHALTPGKGHGTEWLWKAREIGYTGGTCSAVSEDVKRVVVQSAKYIGHCADCRESFPKHRMPASQVGRPLFQHPACKRKPGKGMIAFHAQR